VRAALALLGGLSCFLAVLTFLWLLLFRQPTPLVATGLDLALAPLGFALVEFVRSIRNGEHSERNPRTPCC